MKRVLFFSLFIAIRAFAVNVPCSDVGLWTNPLLRLYAPPGQPPMILLLHAVGYGATFGPAEVRWTGFGYEIVQTVDPSLQPVPSCNLATAQLPAGVPQVIRYTWYYEINGAQHAIASAEVDLGPHDLDLTVVPAHPDASTPVSLVVHYSGLVLEDVPVPRRNGSKIDVRESLGVSGILIAPPYQTRTALLGLLPPGQYDATWSIQYPDLVPSRITQRHLTFTVDPITRRRGTGGGPTAKSAIPCAGGSLGDTAVVDSPATMWLHVHSPGNGVVFGRPNVTFDGTVFHVTQQAVSSDHGVNCEIERVDLTQPLPPGGQYPIAWTTTFVQPDRTIDVHRQFTLLEFDTQPATLHVFPEPAVAGTPLVAIIAVAGPGEPEIAASQPWVRVDGNTIFIDLDEYKPHALTGVCPLPPLAAGTYDVVISVHVFGASIQRTHTTLVVPSAG